MLYNIIKIKQWGVFLMKFKYIFFDFDGTIADTEKINFKILEQLSDKYKFNKLASTELNHAKKMNAFQLMHHLNVKKYKLPFILRKGKKLLKQNIVNIDLCMNNFAEVLPSLKTAGVKLAIITSNSKKNVNLFLEKHNLDCFDFIVSSSLFGKEHKIRKIIKKGKLNPSDVIYVGDEIRDISAAKLANIKIAIVSWGYNSLESLVSYEPDFVLQDPSDLIDVCGVKTKLSLSQA